LDSSQIAIWSVLFSWLSSSWISYTKPAKLFASNVVLPMLGFVYWTDDTKPGHETAINNATLAGCILGQVVFGILADFWGRRKIYGIELLILLAGTIGFAMSASGFGRSMNVISWIIFWRFVSGVGIGADYPLSAVITSE
jgi:MFS transporter, PHS family, inorganic phosphate transporter